MELSQQKRDEILEKINPEARPYDVDTCYEAMQLAYAAGIREGMERAAKAIESESYVEKHVIVATVEGSKFADAIRAEINKQETEE